MPYAINKYNGQLVTTVADGTIDSTTDLKLIGKNYAGYGEVQNENFLFLLESFANNSAPPRPLSGQVWFDLGNKKLKFYDGTKWRTTGGAEIGSLAPVGLTEGDFWFDTTNKQLYAWSLTGGANNSPGFVLVGPQGVAGSGTTQMRSRSLKDTLNVSHAVIEAVANGITIFIVSAEATFTLHPDNLIDGFSIIKQGITMRGVADDGKRSTFKLTGTATSAEGLVSGTTVYTAEDFVRSLNASFAELVAFSDAGFTVGDVPRLRVYISGGNTPIISNDLSENIFFETKVSGTTYRPLKIVGANLVPENDNQSDIGTSSKRYKTIYAATFSGAATKADTLAVGSEYRTASSASSVGTVAVRTSSDELISGTNITAGALKATFFVGTATAANYADLAEKYLADQEYEVGTVVMIGGLSEVTACQPGSRAIGAVSANPAYLMNFELENGTPIALKGRVPVKVAGQVKKGDRLVAGSNGSAIVSEGPSADVFAVALESSDEFDTKLVECLIL